MSKKKSRSSNKKSKRVKHTSNNKETRKHTEPHDDREQPRLIEGEERKVHEEIIERRIGGGEAPTPEAYARALKQWQQLPGSVIRPPTDVTLPTRKLRKSQDTLDISEQTDNDTDKGEQTG